MILEYLAIAAGILFAHILNGSTLFDFGTDIKPDFMLIIVLFFALRRGDLTGLWIGFLGGLLTDAAIGGEQIASGKVIYRIGIHSLSYSLIGYIIGKFGKTVYNENYISIMVYSLISTFFARVFTYYLFSWFFHTNQSYSFIYCSVYNAAIAPVTFFLLSWIYKLEPAQGT
ncbi:MAG: rod shape-determining protein MreD [Leptospiraceae bacterium]|nr:rod shape-determining protein MreD [Leptospiraceae bacterium]